VVAPEAQASLRRLAPEARAAMQNRIDALQHAPRPAEAEAAPSGGEQAYRVGTGDEALRFEVDDARQRVTVLAVGAAGAPEAAHGA
jgi:mRNA-degrading endonuclease RelE of RelBE toxin-antitoxin system